jgi:two-component system, OmpR family, phosphate regulon response regulator PhoB
MATVLVVDDEPIVREVVVRYLTREGYETLEAADGNAARSVIEGSDLDLVVLDVMLPGADGLELCRWIRGRSELPVIMLTARGEESERVRGLATGADDYLVKPFSVPELLARIRTILRRTNPDAVAETLKAGDLALDRKTRRVTRLARDIELSPTEFRLLEHLMQNPGRVFSRPQLLDMVWGRDIYVDERTVDVHVGRLRKSLSRGREHDPIRTVRGMGYSFDERFGRSGGQP